MSAHFSDAQPEAFHVRETCHVKLLPGSFFLSKNDEMCGSSKASVIGGGTVDIIAPEPANATGSKATSALMRSK